MDTNESNAMELVEQAVTSTGSNGWKTAGVVGGVGLAAVLAWEFGFKPAGRAIKKLWNNRKQNVTATVVECKDVEVKTSKK